MSQATALDRFFSIRAFHLVAAAAIAAAVVLVYSGTFHSSFHFDDFRQIVDNPWAKDPSRAIDIFLKKSRPLTLLSFALNYAVSGPGVEGYHVVNVFIHAVNAILVYFVLSMTFSLAGRETPWSRRMAVLVALIFAVHPVQTQAVTYIVQRAESLSAFFYLSALFFFILALRSVARPARLALYAAVPICYGLALAAKEVAITLPAIIVIYDFYFSTNGRFRGVLSRWPLYTVLSLMLVYFAVTTVLPLGGFDAAKERLMNPFGKERAAMEALPGERAWALDFSLASTAYAADESTKAAAADAAKIDRGPVYVTSGFGIYGLGPKDYLLTELNVLVYYMALLAVPVYQNLDYDYPVARRLFERPIPGDGAVFIYPPLPPIVSLAVILLVLGAAVYLFVRSACACNSGKGSFGLLASFFIFWFFIVLLPTSSFIPIIDVMSEQRLYVASIGFFTVLALCIDRLIVFASRRFFA